MGLVEVRGLHVLLLVSWAIVPLSCAPREQGGVMFDLSAMIEDASGNCAFVDHRTHNMVVVVVGGSGKVVWQVNTGPELLAIHFAARDRADSVAVSIADNRLVVVLPDLTARAFPLPAGKAAAFEERARPVYLERQLSATADKPDLLHLLVGILDEKHDAEAHRFLTEELVAK